MSDKQPAPQTPGTLNGFNKGMLKDANDGFIAEGVWTHARNAVNNSHDGQVGVLGNEPANLLCAQLSYPLIGAIHIIDDEWALFSTDDTHCEIGLFYESKCLYTKVISDTRLGFKRTHLIEGTSRKRFDCKRPIYFSDGLNPDRFVDLDNVPYITNKKLVDGCLVETPTNQVDIEALRLTSLVKAPCLSLEKGRGAGTLPNGSYQIAVAYAVNGIKVGEYTISEVQSIFHHQNVAGSLVANVSNTEESFEEIEVVLISVVNQQTTARRLGIYSSHQPVIYIDTIDQTLPTIPLADLVIRSTAYERSDRMYRVNDYLIRSGLYARYAFNYQPQANNISTDWVAIKYPADYYQKGGNNPSLMRDEVHAFFIRWVYNTGERSASFHIPGRKATSSDMTLASGRDAIETRRGEKVKRWQVKNTATITKVLNETQPDGGVILGRGKMGYWESTEKYPDNQPLVYDKLCGKNIRHHKTPDNTIGEAFNHFVDNGASIVILGVAFDNITWPLDAQGNPIDSIIGYEILRGSREGHKSIVAKGILNNMREYSIEENDQLTGLFANYPFNDLRPDKYLCSSKSIIEKGSASDNQTNPLVNYRKDMFSFHSPETNFSRPYISAYELSVYGELQGQATGHFEHVYKHPKFKLPTNFSDILAKVIGVLGTIGTVVQAISDDPKVFLPPSKDIPLTTNLLLKPRTNHSIGAATVQTPDPIIVAENIAIGVYNGLMIAAMLPLQSAVISESLYTLIYGLVPRIQYATQYNAHGFYNNMTIAGEGNRRRLVKDAVYVRDNLQSFGSDFRVNNLNRGQYVLIQTEDTIPDPVYKDTSRVRMKGDGVAPKLKQSFITNISAHYGAIKIALPGQYGQLDQIRQIPVAACLQTKSSSDVFFAGDTYINRYTEKNAMPFFTDWLMDQPDETEYDYRNYINVPYPRYWVNSERGNYKLFQGNAAANRHLNARESSVFFVKQGYFYISCNGVRDFFVESEVNLAQRDYEENILKQHYDTHRYTDISSMFRSDVLTSGNYYKYDYSLSLSKLYNNQISWGEVYARDYDPSVAQACYTYYPNRVVYSLPQNEELKRDNWKIFLVNNYKEFPSRVTTIKSIHKTGALILFENESPAQFNGVDQLQTENGVKLTIGDGGLFEQPLQNILNAERVYEYGSCQNPLSVLSTPHGIFWVSQEQGKIFQYSDKTNEISRIGMKYWFNRYLPSQLKKHLGNYNIIDNPAMGIGVMTIYDPTHEVLYITKRDYVPLRENIFYDESTREFKIGHNKQSVTISLQDKQYFKDVSWTISYDPKANDGQGAFISFHDWHPNYLLSERQHFMTVLNKSIYKHNYRTDLYCNFYNKDYPFEIDYVSATGSSVATMRNIEYVLECYTYQPNGIDKFHALNENFDQAMVYNSEQHSGLLKLVHEPLNPASSINYPIYKDNSSIILYAKEENKYRFNQFSDLTKDRGEFSGRSIQMFQTSENGYERIINPSYVNYQKPATQQKKFRHYSNHIWLSKTKSSDIKMLFKLAETHLQPSVR